MKEHLAELTAIIKKTKAVCELLQKENGHICNKHELPTIQTQIAAYLDQKSDNDKKECAGKIVAHIRSLNAHIKGRNIEANLQSRYVNLGNGKINLSHCCEKIDALLR